MKSGSGKVRVWGGQESDGGVGGRVWVVVVAPQVGDQSREREHKYPSMHHDGKLHFFYVPRPKTSGKKIRDLTWVTPMILVLFPTLLILHFL